MRRPGAGDASAESALLRRRFGDAGARSSDVSAKFGGHDNGYFALIHALRYWASHLPLSGEAAGAPAQQDTDRVRAAFAQFSGRPQNLDMFDQGSACMTCLRASQPPKYRAFRQEIVLCCHQSKYFKVADEILRDIIFINMARARKGILWET